MSPYEFDDDELHTVYVQEAYKCDKCRDLDPWHRCEGGTQ